MFDTSLFTQGRYSYKCIPSFQVLAHIIQELEQGHGFSAPHLLNGDDSDGCFHHTF